MYLRKNQQPPLSPVMSLLLSSPEAGPLLPRPPRAGRLAEALTAAPGLRAERPRQEEDKDEEDDDPAESWFDDSEEDNEEVEEEYDDYLHQDPKKFRDQESKPQTPKKRRPWSDGRRRRETED